MSFIKSYLKNFVKFIFAKFNIKIIKSNSKTLYVEEGKTETKVSKQTLSDIFRFFQEIDPFYNDDIKEELRIAGAWRDDLKIRRKNTR